MPPYPRRVWQRYTHTAPPLLIAKPPAWPARQASPGNRHPPPQPPSSWTPRGGSTTPCSHATHSRTRFHLCSRTATSRVSVRPSSPAPRCRAGSRLRCRCREVAAAAVAVAAAPVEDSESAGARGEQWSRPSESVRGKVVRQRLRGLERARRRRRPASASPWRRRVSSSSSSCPWVPSVARYTFSRCSAKAGTPESTPGASEGA
jgi:hypothetical protein